MTPSFRVRLVVVLLAVTAAAVVASVVYATRQDPPQPKATCRTPARILAGSKSRNVAAVRAAMQLPARQAAKKLEPLAQQYPADPVVAFNDGLALACAGFLGEATTELEQAKKDGRDTYYEIAADNLLHPQFFTEGYPLFQYQGPDKLLVEGETLQHAGHQESAEKVWARDAKLHPGSDAAQVAAAVGLFDMDDIAKSFSHLGPLVKEFPKSQSVRFHLGLLLVWTGQAKQAIVEFRAAQKLGPETVLGRQAEAFLAKLVPSGTNPSKR